VLDDHLDGSKSQQSYRFHTSHQRFSLFDALLEQESLRGISSSLNFSAIPNQSARISLRKMTPSRLKDGSPSIIRIAMTPIRIF
jgi:hypothetical protein